MPFRLFAPFSRASLVAVLFLSLALAPIGCDRAAEPGTEDGSTTEQPADPADVLVRVPRNCLIIVMDATRASSCSLHGHERETTPNLDALAREGMYFTRMYSQSTSTSPSIWSMFTGQYPYRPTSKPRIYNIRPEDRSFPQAFQAAGFATGGFSENPFIDHKTHFDRGFDVFERYSWHELKGITDEYFRDGSSSETIASRTREWIGAQGDSPWFCYVHFLRPHNPYIAPDPYAEKFVTVPVPEGEDRFQHLHTVEKNILMQTLPASELIEVPEEYIPSQADVDVVEKLYDGNLAYTDALVGDIIAFLRDQELLEDTLVIVTSDHGESFLEHDKLLHATEPYEELIWVPFVVRAPKAMRTVGGPVDRPAELLDVVPTLAQTFGLEIDWPTYGESFLGSLLGRDAAEKDYLYSENLKTDTLSVRRGDMKLLVRFSGEDREIAGTELYDLSKDPGELDDISASGLDYSDLLERAKVYAATQAEGETLPLSALTDEEIRSLEALGYLQ